MHSNENSIVFRGDSNYKFHKQYRMYLQFKKLRFKELCISKASNNEIVKSFTSATTLKDDKTYTEAESRFRLCGQLAEKCGQHSGGIFSVQFHFCRDRRQIIQRKIPLLYGRE